MNKEYMEMYKSEIYEIGKNKLFNDCTYFCMLDNDLSYKEFIDKSIINIPDWISKRDFIKLFKNEFKEQYEQRQSQL